MKFRRFLNNRNDVFSITDKDPLSILDPHQHLQITLQKKYSRSKVNNSMWIFREAKELDRSINTQQKQISLLSSQQSSLINSIQKLQAKKYNPLNTSSIKPNNYQSKRNNNQLIYQNSLLQRPKTCSSLFRPSNSSVYHQNQKKVFAQQAKRQRIKLKHHLSMSESQSLLSKRKRVSQFNKQRQFKKYQLETIKNLQFLKLKIQKQNQILVCRQKSLKSRMRFKKLQEKKNEKAERISKLKLIKKSLQAQGNDVIQFDILQNEMATGILKKRISSPYLNLK